MALGGLFVKMGESSDAQSQCLGIQKIKKQETGGKKAAVGRMSQGVNHYHTSIGDIWLRNYTLQS